MSLITAILVATALRAAELQKQPVLERPSSAVVADQAEPSMRPRLQIGAASGTAADRSASPSGSGGSAASSAARNGGHSGNAGRVGSRPVIPLEPASDGSDGSGESDVNRRATSLGSGFWAAAWSSIPSGLENLEVMVRIDGNGVGDDSWTSRTRFNAPWIASELALRPAGRRFLFGWRYRHCLLSDTLDRVSTPTGGSTTWQSPFLDEASASIRAELDPLLAALDALGARPDGLILDIESAGSLSSWQISPEHLEAILQDPRSRTRTMSNGRTPIEMLAGYTPSQLLGTTAGRGVWNAVIDLLFADAMNESMFAPAVERWPRIVGSNYRTFAIKPEETSPNHNGHPMWGAGVFGTSSSVSTYGRVRNLARFWDADPADPRRLTRTDSGSLRPDGWTGLLVDLNQTRAIRRSGHQRFQPWLAQSDWVSDDENGSRYPGSPYWAENIFHQALGGAEVFLYWNPAGAVHEETAAQRQIRFADARRLDAVLKELNTRLRGATDLTPCRTERLPWNADAVLSGAILPDDTGVWRVTLSPRARSVRMRIAERMVEVLPDGAGAWLLSEPGEQVEIVEVRIDGGATGRF